MAEKDLSTSITEILRNPAGYPADILPPLRAAYDTSRGMTRALLNRNIANALENDPRLLELLESLPAAPEEAAVPTLADVLSFYGYKDTKDKKGYEQFLEDFPKNLQKMKKKALNDPRWGAEGWETIRQFFRQATQDQGAIDREKAKAYAVEGLNEKGEIENYPQWAAAKFSKLLAPRSMKAVTEGREPTLGETLTDIGANAAYTIPAGRATGILAKGAPYLLREAAKGASQFAVPVAVAGVDLARSAATGGDYDLGDFATDAAVGGLVNLGINRMLVPGVAGAIGAGVGKSHAPTGVIRGILEGRNTPEEMAVDLIRKSRKISAQGKSSISEGLRNAETVAATPSDILNAQRILDVAATPSGVMQGKTGKVLVDAATGKPLTGSRALEVVEGQLKDAYPAVNADDVLGSIVSQYKNPAVAALALSDAAKAQKNIYRDVFRAHPELKSLFYPSKILGPGKELGLAYASNLTGSVSPEAGGAAAKKLGVPGPTELIKRNADRKAEEGHKASVSEILSAPDMDSEDIKWLSVVRDNPKVLQYGYADDPEGFKRWLLERGSDLLRGTPMYRPAWGAE